MSLLESGRPPRDILPPINRPDFDKARSEQNESLRYSVMPNLSISTAPMGSPTALYAGPPPPYSCGPSTTESAPVFTGYFSPPLSSTRRSTRDEKDLTSAKTLPSLPSLHEALGGDKSRPFTNASAVTQSIPPGSGPPSAPGLGFSDPTRGPPNPFAHGAPPSSLVSTSSHVERPPLRPTLSTNVGSEAPLYLSQPYSTSPQANHMHRTSIGSFSSSKHPYEPSSSNQHNSVETGPHSAQPRDLSSLPASQPSRSGTFKFEPTLKLDGTRNPFVGTNPQSSYGETVKRHLDVFDAELALSEIGEISAKTTEFSRTWIDQYHASHRSTYFADIAPSIPEIDEMIRQQQRLIENFHRIRELVLVEQTALTEQRALAARSHLDEDQRITSDEYKSGGFAGGDAKKRRGKAAPPGRCHSCHRAETPEWRRGPDGARTLCNACGLHYAKLTRKLGANKNSNLAGSNLRPKNLDPRPPLV